MVGDVRKRKRRGVVVTWERGDGAGKPGGAHGGGVWRASRKWGGVGQREEGRLVKEFVRLMEKGGRRTK